MILFCSVYFIPLIPFGPSVLTHCCQKTPEMQLDLNQRLIRRVPASKWRYRKLYTPGNHNTV